MTRNEQLIRAELEMAANLCCPPDLTTITTPFGLLDDETQAQLRAAEDAGMYIQYYSYLGSWIEKKVGIFNFGTTYRLAPGQVWPKPEPKRAVLYVHLLEDGTTRYGPPAYAQCLVETDGIKIIARVRVEIVEGQFDD